MSKISKLKKNETVWIAKTLDGKNDVYATRSASGLSVTFKRSHQTRNFKTVMWSDVK